MVEIECASHRQTFQFMFIVFIMFVCVIVCVFVFSSSINCHLLDIQADDVM